MRPQNCSDPPLFLLVKSPIFMNSSRISIVTGFLQIVQLSEVIENLNLISQHPYVESIDPISFPEDIWFLVWNMNCIFPYIGNNHPIFFCFFSQRGWYTTNQINQILYRDFDDFCCYLGHISTTMWSPRTF